MLDPTSLLLEQVIFEVRYEHGYLYWDNMGKIWKTLQAKFPDLKADTVSTDNTILRLANEELTLRVGPNALNITQNYPNNLRLVGEFADVAVSTVIKYLDTTVLTRIGNRFKLLKKVKNADESIAYLRKLGFSDIFDNKVKKIGDRIKDPQIKFVIQKGEDIGYIFNVAHVERKIEIQLPKPVIADFSAFISMALSIDVDFFTMKTVDSSIVRPHDIIKNNKSEVDYFITELFT